MTAITLYLRSYRYMERNNLSVLQYVPEDLRIKELCLMAVKKRSSALEFVPAHLITQEMCLTAMKDFRFNHWIIEYIPNEYKEPELWTAAVQNDYQAIEEIPDEYKTPELCLLAVKKMAVLSNLYRRV